MLVLLAVVQAPRSKNQGGVGKGDVPSALSLESFETLAEYRLADGWAPRFQGAQDPDQGKPWPSAGGFEAPWEPASPFLGDQGFAMNGPHGTGRDPHLAGPGVAALPLRGAHLLGAPGSRQGQSPAGDPCAGCGSFRDAGCWRCPRGRVLWASDSGPWSRFSWDGKAVLFGLRAPAPEGAWLLTTLPVEGEVPPQTLAPWDESGMPRAPKGWITQGRSALG